MTAWIFISNYQFVVFYTFYKNVSTQIGFVSIFTLRDSYQRATFLHVFYTFFTRFTKMSVPKSELFQFLTLWDSYQRASFLHVFYTFFTRFTKISVPKCQYLNVSTKMSIQKCQYLNQSCFNFQP